MNDPLRRFLAVAWPFTLVLCLIAFIGVLTTRSEPEKAPDLGEETITIEEARDLGLKASLAARAVKRWQEAHAATTDILRRRYNSKLTREVWKEVLADELDCSYEEFAADLAREREMRELKNTFDVIHKKYFMTVYSTSPTVTIRREYPVVIAKEHEAADVRYRRMRRAHELLTNHVHNK